MFSSNMNLKFFMLSRTKLVAASENIYDFFPSVKWKATAVLLVAQVLFVIFFGVFVEYGKEVGPRPLNDTEKHGGSNEQSELDRFYPSKYFIQVTFVNQ